MSRLRFCLLLAVICSCSQYGLAGSITTPETVIIPLKPVEAEKAPEIVVSDKTSPAPTTPAPSTPAPSTPAPTTPAPSTPAPSTPAPTTPAPTTPSPPTPAPTPDPKPTPAPAPIPVPPPEQGSWNVTDTTTKAVCIVAQFAAQLNVTYPKSVNNVTSLTWVLLNVPTNSSVTGNCSEDQWIQLSWLAKPESTLANNLTLVYHRNDTTKNYWLKSLNVSLAAENFADIVSNDSIELYHGAEWQTPVATSYRCRSATQLNMTAESASAVAVLTISRLQEEAYRTTNNTEFSAARECGGGDVPDAVPIAVGCALGGLVLVVLIAYLVGRRRSAARGYLSM